MEKPILAAMLSCSSVKLSDAEKRLFEKYNPLGVTLFGRNLVSPAQIQALTKEIKETVGRDDVLIAVDQEGGRVRRLQGDGFYDIVSMEQLGNIAAKQGIGKAIAAAIEHSILTCQDLHKAGFNFNYAPVLDIAYPETTPALRNRCFGSDEKLIVLLGGVMAEEYAANGICPCIKHLPGHGRAQADPHLHLPVITASLKELEKDFYPFRQLNQTPAGMTAHVVIEAVDDLPATQSSKVIREIIRGVIEFDGLLISDAIEMKALSGTAAEKAAGALKAGCDAVCYCSGNAAEMEEVCRSCTNLADKSLIRFAKIKNIIQTKLNTEVLAEAYYEITGPAETYDSQYDATEVLHRMQQKD